MKLLSAHYKVFVILRVTFSEWNGNEFNRNTYDRIDSHSTDNWRIKVVFACNGVMLACNFDLAIQLASCLLSVNVLGLEKNILIKNEAFEGLQGVSSYYLRLLEWTLTCIWTCFEFGLKNCLTRKIAGLG